eukprot:gnl/MRDRNA2_/MRDRNA2_19410_c0_seq1.p1 gnl/MRDRNA2_/MRDRNA2_19410_c0~~gnl/MRDRNA2_/MRDRNA2_19410_c0_seq1.p1  ORF type:complete len:742 (+),score=164.86 gnl/MRDRNA2_/MRDRNA2_19410_c0_seq1:154-2379(+)
MSAAQKAELEGLVTTSLSSHTIEWAHNLQVCDMLQANPSFAPVVLRQIRKALQSTSAVTVQLALSLLEMAVKNCGLPICRLMDETFVEAMVALVKKKQSVAYSLGRNLNKSLGSWLPGAGIGETQRKQWASCSSKVLEMLQLWADAFMLQEGQVKPLFDAYKQLRTEGYRFPSRDTQAGLMINGAEESPAFTAFGGGSSSQAASHASTSPSQEPSFSPNQERHESSPSTPAQCLSTSATLTADQATVSSPETVVASNSSLHPSQQDLAGPLTPEEVDELRQALARLQGNEAHESQDLLDLQEEPPSPDLEPEERARLVSRIQEFRPRMVKLIERHTDEMGADADLDEALLLGMISLHDTLETVLAAETNEADAEEDADQGDDEEEAVPAPPSAPAPDKEQQEKYDLMLAKWLQEQEDKALAEQTAQDAAYAAMLQAMDDPQPQQPQPPSSPTQVICGMCHCVNHINLSNLTSNRQAPLFVCYRCHTTQSVPVSARSLRSQLPPALQAQRTMQSHFRQPGGYAGSSASSMRLPSEPQRHAPPARSMAHLDPNSSGSELLIGNSGPDKDESIKVEEERKSKKKPMQYYAAGGGNTERCESLLGGGGSGGGSSGSGKGGGESSLEWAKTHVAQSLASLATPAPRGLGDGVPCSSRYASMGSGDDDASQHGLLQGGPVGRQAQGMGFRNPFRRKRKKEDSEESLLGRHQIDDDWEVLRQADGTSYYHNLVTGTTQWEPPPSMMRE